MQQTGIVILLSVVEFMIGLNIGNHGKVERIRKMEDDDINPNAIIVSDLHYDKNRLLTIDITLGTPPQSFTLYLGLSSDITWVSKVNGDDRIPIPHHFDPSASSTFLEFEGITEFWEYNTELGVCLGFPVNDEANVFDVSISYNWLLAYGTNIYFPGGDGVLGLGRDFNKENFFSLYSFFQIVTPLKVVSFKPGNSTYPNPMIFFGNIHSDFPYTLDKYQTATCKLITSEIIEEQHHWQCNNTVLVIGDYTKPFNKTNSTVLSYPILFATEFYSLQFPYQAIDAFLNYMPSNCLKTGSQSFYLIKCSEISEVKNISLEFNEYLVVLPKKTLWLQNPNDHTWILQIIFIEGYNKIALSLAFFDNYHILFDNDNNTVVMVPNNEGMVVSLNDLNNKPPKYSIFWIILFSLLALLVITIIISVLSWFFCKSKNSASPKEYEIDLISSTE